MSTKGKSRKAACCLLCTSRDVQHQPSRAAMLSTLWALKPEPQELALVDHFLTKRKREGRNAGQLPAIHSSVVQKWSHDSTSQCSDLARAAETIYKQNRYVLDHRASFTALLPPTYILSASPGINNFFFL